MRRWILACCVAVAGCGGRATLKVQPPEPEPESYMVPLSANPSDLICAETPPNVVHNYCMSIREFRLAVQPSIRATP